MPKYVDLTLDRGIKMSASVEETEDTILQRGLATRVSQNATEHATFAEWCRRADALYHPTTFTDGGADLWPDDPSATTEGRSHVSVNTPKAYVDIPAALQAVKPIENMLATDDTPEARHAANAMERIYKAWKAEDKFELKFHKATTLKALYGRTAGFVYYDRALKRPCAKVVQNPRNLYMGYKDDDYEELTWAANRTLVEPMSLTEQFSVEVTVRDTGEVDAEGNSVLTPWVVGPETGEDARPRPQYNYGPARIEVWDYWFQRVGKLGKRGEPSKMETWNVVVAGNAVVRGPYKYAEYEGTIPYVPLFNTYIPGMPTGAGELHDIEHLIREKMERITAGAQMIAGGTGGDFWQLTGPDAPSRVPASAKPRRNEVIAPGAGNRVEAITPFIAQFQLEQYLGRLDREMAVVSGLNDLLLGLAPAQVLSSSKAINALIANYESRLAMRRLLLYTWRRDMWELAVKVWAAKDKNVAAVLKAGGGVLDIIDPSLSPRDEMETATRARNLVDGKLWSQARGMDATGVDDPEQEQNIIREERTDATLFPESVQVMAQLLAALQSLGLQAPANAQAQAGAQLQNGQKDLRQALGAGQAAANTTSSQLPGDQGIGAPPIPGAGPDNAGAAPFAQAPGGDAGIAQTMIQGGQAKSRILTQQKLGRK